MIMYNMWQINESESESESESFDDLCMLCIKVYIIECLKI